MARNVKATSGRKASAATPKIGRITTSARKAPAKTTRPGTGAKQASASMQAVPKLSKDELRAQVEKLERTNATLRTRQKDANRAAKGAATRIAELEDQVSALQNQVTTLEKKLASASSARQGAKAPKRARATRRPRDIDPGDAVPEGVAVLEPEPLDQEAETALDNLEQHLHK